MKEAPSTSWIKFGLSLFVAIIVATLFFRAFKKISGIFKSKSEKAIDIADDLSTGRDYLEPGEWLNLLPKEKKPSELVDFKKITNVAIDWYIADKYYDPVLFLISLKKLNTKLEVSLAANTLFKVYKLNAKSVAIKLRIYVKVKKIIDKLPKY